MGGQNVIIRGNQDGQTVDVQSSSLSMSPLEEIRIAQGLFFSADAFNAAVADAGEFEVLIQVPAGVEPHMSAGLAVGGDCLVQLFEGATFSAPGSTITPINLDRRSANAADVLTSEGPTVTADGTQLVNQFIAGGSGSNGRTPGGSGNIKLTYILAESTAYVLRITNNAGNAEPVGIALYWFEEPQG